MTESWPAPAKLNLFLHVTGRRPDGYHLLQTVFQFLEAGDELDFRLTDDARITRATALPGVPPEKDLCVRAAALLQAECGSRQGVEIHLAKHLPQGGGLGGGSSDAATTLLALNVLWGCHLPRERLAALGMALGADVPVFVRGQAAWGEGAGEQLTPIDLPEPWYVVLDPRVSVSTAEIFAAPELTRTSPPITIRDFLAGKTHNDLEPVVRARYPRVAAALDWLSDFGPARMTGSGGCVFVPVADQAAGQAILAQCPAEWSGFVARGRNRHPIEEMLFDNT